MRQIITRAQGRLQRTLAGLLYRRPMKIPNTIPYISFTFDDFPRSALHTGGGILNQCGLKATYYASFGLMGKETPSGTIFVLDDIKELLACGHELGCHTFEHCHALETNPSSFEDSIIKNRHALEELVPGTAFTSFSYPISGPRIDTKRRAGKHFLCSRNGGQTFNTGVTDLNLLRAYFLEKSRDNSQAIRQVIEQNSRARGWLIFATHDISETPTPYGCTPSFFEHIVKISMESGARILPVAGALDAIRADY